MSCGKYSPTISSSYALDQDWWTRNGGGYGNGTSPDSDNDNDGFDSYGYRDGDGVDRAGHTEMEYLTDSRWIDDGEEYWDYPLYNDVSSDWSGVLLGDLNDYVGPQELAKLAGRTQREISIYWGVACSFRHILCGFGQYSVYVHRDDVDAYIAALAPYFKGDTQ